ncbi:MAG: FG-GAP-like repeat-containing protein [Planctomycetota bacterium]|nr:FG-GAP-like repeat-containing protein [Planctomycetota bacterium]
MRAGSILNPRSIPLDFDHPLKHLFIHGFAAGGVCIGDCDGDGKPDIYLVGQVGPNKLYRQVAPMRFEDVTERAGVSGGAAWGAGATFIDIDNDSDLDLYVCNYDSPNLLYVNQGDGTFRELGAAAGLAFRGASIMAAFADIDRDGDLDVYLLTNRIYSPIGRVRRPRVIKTQEGLALQPGFEETHRLQTRVVNGERQQFMVQAGQRDRLYRNNGDGTFTDISAEAGIAGNHPGLSATWWDFNQDGWPDIYVSNDYWDADRMYRNNGNGTFTDVIRSSVPHCPWFSMGADLADINNDGRVDFLAADMSGTTHFVSKMTMGDMADSRWFLESAEPRQYMRNALYLNTGTDRFMEVAYLAGLASTDWTWSVKFGDLDNDGRVDAFFTNGTLNQSFNPDFASQQEILSRALRFRYVGHQESEDAHWDLYRKAPPRRESNLAFRNLGDLRFERTESRWGLDRVGISFAAALSDLDRDGDLDLVVGNLGEAVSVYRNRSASGRSVLLRLVGVSSNRFGIGCTVRLRSASGPQVRQVTLARGYMSANEPIVHFGMGADEIIERLAVEWPSGHRQAFENLQTNRLYTITEPDGVPPPAKTSPRTVPRFREAAKDLGLTDRHRETPFDDYARQPLLPQKHSQLGPGLAWGDADGDGDEDLFVGGAAGQAGRLFIDSGGGRFSGPIRGPWEDDRRCEDMAPLWFDADSDGDMDLYVSSGGVECPPGDDVLRDRLYLNDGQARFEKAAAGALPDVADSSGVVVAADFDGDGDLDLFVGGRIIPGRYPLTPDSRLLRNEAGRFADCTDVAAPGLRHAGLVTGALWSDADNDGRLDLLIALEWGGVRFWRNTGGKLVDRSIDAGLEGETGWWNGITGTDIDSDGDIDYVVTNLGLNTKYHAEPDRPARLYYGDFDGSGRARLVEAEYENDRLFPVRGRSCSSAAMPFIGAKFSTFESFARADLAGIYTPEAVAGAETFEAVRFHSAVLINSGKARFELRPLPALAQAAPGYGVVAADLDGDSHPDVCIAQNNFSPQPETGRMDGGLCMLLRGSRAGTLSPVFPVESGLIVPGDVKGLSLCDLDRNGWPDLVMTQNDGPLLAFLNTGSESDGHCRVVAVRLRGPAGNPNAVGARISVLGRNGARQTAEVYCGSGYLSQSTSWQFFGVEGGDDRPRRLIVRWPDGRQSSHVIDSSKARVTLAQPSD